VPAQTLNPRRHSRRARTEREPKIPITESNPHSKTQGTNTFEWVCRAVVARGEDDERGEGGEEEQRGSRAPGRRLQGGGRVARGFRGRGGAGRRRRRGGGFVVGGHLARRRSGRVRRAGVALNSVFFFLPLFPGI